MWLSAVVALTTLAQASHRAQASVPAALPGGPLHHDIRPGPSPRASATSHNCSAARYLVTQPAPWSGFANKLHTLHNGLQLAAATRRTLLLLPLAATYGAGLHWRDILDLQALRGFWPCFVEVDEAPAWVAELYADMYDPAHASHGFDGTKAYEAGQVAAYFDPTGRDGKENMDLAQVAAWATGLGGSFPILRFDAMFFMCTRQWESERRFWAHIQPAPPLLAELDAFRAQRLAGPYAAVHLRGLDAGCANMTAGFFQGAPLRAAAGAMCNLTLALLRDILAVKGVAVDHIFVASDGQLPAVEAEYRQAGAVFYSAPGSGDRSAARQDGSLAAGRGGARVFLPAADLFLLAGADLAAGNMASTLAGAAANLRAVCGLQTVLGWPEPRQAFQPFWQCSKTQFWCGAARVQQPLMNSYQRTDCYPELSPDSAHATLWTASMQPGSLHTHSSQEHAAAAPPALVNRRKRSKPRQSWQHQRKKWRQTRGNLRQSQPANALRTG